MPSWLTFTACPVSELLPGDVLPTLIAPAPKLVIDLERMATLPKDKAGPLSRYVATIQSQRGDYNGRVLVDPPGGPALPGRHLRQDAG